MDSATCSECGAEFADGEVPANGLCACGAGLPAGGPAEDVTVVMEPDVPRSGRTISSFMTAKGHPRGGVAG